MAATAPTVGGPRRLDPVALAGVMTRDIVIFGRYWRSTTFSSVVEPTIYLLAFGFGFGSLVSDVAGYRYLDFVGTGTVATAILFSSVFPAMFATFVRRKFQRTYDALLAAPVDVEEIVTAEVLWLALRAGTFGVAPLLVAIAFGLEPGPGALLIPFVGILTGFGFAALGVTFAALVESIDTFGYIVSIVVTPLFLVAGTFFPVSTLPGWAATAAQFNPLYHCVELVRHCTFGLDPAADLAHVGALTFFGVAIWRVAIWRTRLRLID